MPGAAAQVVPTPPPLVDKDAFVDLFARLCLSGPASLSEFDQTAAGLGLVKTRDSESATELHRVWQAPKEYGNSAMELSVSAGGDIIYEVRGNPSNLPKRTYSCTVTAYLPELTPDEEDALERTANGALRRVARALDFNASSEGYQVTPRDIDLSFQPGGKNSYSSTDPTSACTYNSPCWSMSPYRLALDVVIARYP